jgi:hypothetical protein
MDEVSRRTSMLRALRRGVAARFLMVPPILLGCATGVDVTSPNHRAGGNGGASPDGSNEQAGEGGSGGSSAVGGSSAPGGSAGTPIDGSLGDGGQLGIDTGSPVGTGGANSRDASDSGSRSDVATVTCGSRTCVTGEYCCNPSCSICTPLGSGCSATPCAAEAGPDTRRPAEGGIDASGACNSSTSLDILCNAGTPHFFFCPAQVPAPAPGCVVRGDGDPIPYCCP